MLELWLQPGVRVKVALWVMMIKAGRVQSYSWEFTLKAASDSDGHRTSFSILRSSCSPCLLPFAALSLFVMILARIPKRVARLPVLPRRALSTTLPRRSEALFVVRTTVFLPPIVSAQGMLYSTGTLRTTIQRCALHVLC